MENPVKLLWTGGWDSTFRLLDLLLVKKRAVQPYYIISRSRQSCEMEIKTMEKIRNLIFKKNPETRKMLLPLITKERNSIAISKDITEKYNRLFSITYLGDQYVYLASFAEGSHIDDLELAIHRDDQAHKFIEDYVVEEKDYFRLKDLPYQSDLTLFKYFRFPILNYTKLDMEQLALKHDFLDIMNQTWFCHSPIHGQPCGVCNPCRTTSEEGMQRRLPFRGRIRYFTHFKVKPALKKILRAS
ncbi:MAG TPA: hypothetical protein VD908_19560 [Cytophagales bacterium]|nr:hypothetical protein [Cytophagales bacterium]